MITMLDADGEPVGFTATSMTSLGATPPLLSFNVARGASSWPALCGRGFVAVHTLSAANVELAQRMSGPKEHRFTADDWNRGPHNLPIFAEASAVIIGKIRELHDVEQNAVVIVDVLEGLFGAEQGGLVYHQRSYFGLGSNLS